MNIGDSVMEAGIAEIAILSGKHRCIADTDDNAIVAVKDFDQRERIAFDVSVVGD